MLLNIYFIKAINKVLRYYEEMWIDSKIKEVNVDKYHNNKVHTARDKNG